MIKKLIAVFFVSIFATLFAFADNSVVKLSNVHPTDTIVYLWSKEKPLTIIVPDDAAKVAFSGVPAGLKYDKYTSQLLGTPKKPGNYVVTAKITDYHKKTQTKKFNLRVKHFTDADDMFMVRAESYDDFVSMASSRDRENHGNATFMPFVGLDQTGYLPRAFRLNDSRNTLKLTGLPPGLKFNPNTYEITGAITKAGTYVVYATITTPNKESFVSTFSIQAGPLPNWVVGTFNGMVKLDDNSFLQMTATVSANGKISAKVFDYTGTYRTYSGNLSWSDGVYTAENLSGFGFGWIYDRWETPDKYGRYTSLSLRIVQRGTTGVGILKGSFQESSPYVSGSVALDQNPWTAKQKLPTPTFASGYYYGITLADKTFLTHKFGSKGKVAVKCYAYKGAKKFTSCSATVSAYKNGSYFQARMPYTIKSPYGNGLGYWWDFKIYTPKSFDSSPMNRIGENWNLYW